MSNIGQHKPVISVIGTGGTGTNLAYKISRLQTKAVPGHADIEFSYFDTSRANYRSDIPSESFYHVEGKDGSGSVRGTNLNDIQPHVKSFLHKHKPGDLVIVLHSASGGTGSVAGPLIVKECLSRDIPVLPLVIGDKSTTIFSKNTLGTIQSYENIALSLKVPVVMGFLFNQTTDKRAQVDNRIQTIVTLLSMLFSRENRELDSRDLRNLLRYDTVTGHRPGLSLLQVVAGDQLVEVRDSILAAITVGPEDKDLSLDRSVDYHKTGFLPSSIDGILRNDAPHHFLVTDGLLHQHVSELKKFVENAKEAANVRVDNRNILSSDSEVTDSGIVL